MGGMMSSYGKRARPQLPSTKLSIKAIAACWILTLPVDSDLDQTLESFECCYTYISLLQKYLILKSRMLGVRTEPRNGYTVLLDISAS